MSYLPKGLSSHEALAHISQTQVIATENRNSDGVLTDIHVELPYNPYCSAEYDETEDEPNTMAVYTLEISPELRRNGIATRLMSSLVYVAKINDVSSLHGSVESQHSIRIFRKLFSEGDIVFSDGDPITKELVTLPMTIDQAISSLERAEEFEANLDYRSICFLFQIDLGNVALSNLEKPIIKT